MQYRSSCDRCQDAKVRCCQTKPACKRCTKKGSSCVYSPFRTIGRPRKRPAPDTPGDDEVLASRAFPRLNHDPHHLANVEKARQKTGVEAANHPHLPSPDTLSTQSSIAEHAGIGSGHILDQMALDASHVEAHISSGCPAMNGSMFPLPPDTSRPAVTLFGGGRMATASCAEQWLESCPHYGGSPITWPSGNTSIANLETNCPWNSSNDVTEVTTGQECDKEDAASTAAHAIKDRATFSQDTTGATEDCYLVLLNQLAQVENFLAPKTPENPPPIDFILRNVNELRELKERIFTCQGHDTTIPVTITTTKTAPCLFSPRPLLLILCLLSERVVQLLEDLFRRATSLAGPFDDELPVLSSTESRRMKRTMYSLIDCTSTCPFPEANQPMHVGHFEVSEEVKARALRWILRRRIQGLLATMGDMKLVAGGQDRDQNGAILSMDQSNAVLNESCGKLVEDLHSRVETLLGRVDLTA